MTEFSNIKWSDSRTLPDIRAEQLDGDIVELELFANADLFQFQGHFPEEPVLPGVAQIDWAAVFARKYFDITGNFTRLGQLKFSRLIVAGAVLRLRLEWHREKGRLHFAYHEGSEKCSSGFFELTDL